MNCVRSIATLIGSALMISITLSGSADANSVTTELQPSGYMSESIDKRIVQESTVPAPRQLKQASSQAKVDFAAQVRKAGLTSTQAKKLQLRVNNYLTKLKGRQVAINKISLGNGADLLLVLPGEKRARDLDRSDGYRAAAPNFCRYHYICAYSRVNFYGDALNMSQCGYHIHIPDWGAGSWANNQTKGTQAYMYRMTSAGTKLAYTTPGAYSADTHGDWTNIWSVIPCGG